MNQNTTERQLPGSLNWVVKLTRIMDTAFKIPGTKISFGFDAIIGLVPFLGEAVTLFISGSMLLTMSRYGVSPEVVLRMLWNILLDWLIGSVPIIGDLFDVAYKANRRNLELLRLHYEEDRYRKRFIPAVILALAGLLGLMALAIYGTFELGRWFIGLFF